LTSDLFREESRNRPLQADFPLLIGGVLLILEGLGNLNAVALLSLRGVGDQTNPDGRRWDQVIWLNISA